MHYHCEIILPPTDSIEAAITSIMAPFNEQAEDRSNHAFWDWWVIGGRWAGVKQENLLDPEKLAQFHQWLKNEGVTVSGIQTGKQALEPPSQIAKVDAKWQELFQVSTPCSIFKHSNDPYSKVSKVAGDVLRVGELNDRMTCNTLIIACPGYVHESPQPWSGPLKTAKLCHQQIWNGVDWQNTTFTGGIRSEIEEYRKKVETCKPDYRAVAFPTDDWLAVTIDYHS